MTSAMFRSFLEYGMTMAQKGNEFARLRDFYTWGAFVGQYAEFDKQVALSIKEIRAQGNVKGAAVRFRDPLKGPFDGAEQRAIIDAIRRQVGTPEDRAVVMIHLELGPNPLSIARLKAQDLAKFTIKSVVAGQSHTQSRYQVALPRMKKRKELRETKVRPLSKELGSLLDRLKGDGPDSFLFHWLNPNYPEGCIREAMHRFSAAGELVSPRTGKPMLLTPRRFRYTLATEMAREGAAPAQIAAVLDHTDLQNVNMYVEASSYVVDQVGKRFDSMFEPIARTFLGKIMLDRITPNKLNNSFHQLPRSCPCWTLAALDCAAVTYGKMACVTWRHHSHAMAASSSRRFERDHTRRFFMSWKTSNRD